VTPSSVSEALAHEFSIREDEARTALDLLSAGLRPPYLARFRRAEVGGLSDGQLRHLERRARELEELERRRETIVRLLTEAAAKPLDAEAVPWIVAPGKLLGQARAERDRAALEDLLLPLRRPEPEVQAALDRGLGALADLMVAPVAGPASTTEEDASPTLPVAEDSIAVEEAPLPVEDSEDSTGDAGQAGGTHAAEAANEVEDETSVEGGEPALEALAHLAIKVDLSPQLARACRPFVNTDRAVHDEMEALEGAMRILADRLARHPALRALVRRLMRKHGVLTVKAHADEKKLGRFRSLVKLRAPFRQVQGQRLLLLRQAWNQRLVQPVVLLDARLALDQVRAALGKRLAPEFASVAHAVAERALLHRLIPTVAEDVKGELRDAAEEEAIRFLALHARQVLLAPHAPGKAVAGIDVNAKGDWTLVALEPNGTPRVPEARIEAGGKDAASVAVQLGAWLETHGVRVVAVSNSRAARESVLKLRVSIRSLGRTVDVMLVNDAGLASWASSEAARSELAEVSVPARQAIGLGRRFQDPLLELLKCDTRSLGLGPEQAVVSKAHLRRVLHDALESCVAAVGCELESAPLSVLRHVPGLDFDSAKRLVQRRAERPFTSREELRAEGLLDETRWRNASSFLRISKGVEPLDRTALHPEQYELVRRLAGSVGLAIEDLLGRRDALAGIPRDVAGVDEATWRELQRELAHPARDPRSWLWAPELLVDDEQPTLEKGCVVEGIVASVAAFGAFVDLGLAREAVVPVREISDRYVRDARTALSIGQVVRARVVDAGGPRIELSLRNVPPPERPRGGPPRSVRRARPEHESQSTAGERSVRRERQGEPDVVAGHGAGQDRPQLFLRAARSRRDGLGSTPGTREERRGARRRSGDAASRTGSERDGGTRAGREGSHRRGNVPGGRGERRDRDDGYDPEAVKRASHSAGSYNPFASFFKSRSDEESEGEKEKD
jgi:uncharacterized protein